MKAGEIRTVEVRPPSRSNESFIVTMVASGIAMCALYGIVLRTGPPVGVGGALRSVDNLPFQTTFQDLPSSEQRIVRQLLEGFTEAKRIRADTGRWPGPEKLAADQIPPFATDAIDKAGYRWSQLRDGLVVNYLGTAEVQGNPDFLLLIQEPDPVGAELLQPGVVDEEHQLLPDGKLLHVTYWKRAAGGARAAIIARPEVERWTQIRIGIQEPLK